MTEKPNGRSKSAGVARWLWMVLAVVAMGGFMAWLGVNSQPQAVAVVDESLGSGPGEYVPGQPVAVDDIAGDPVEWVDREITLADVAVSSRLGDAAFWVVASNGTPFLVKLGEGVLAEGGSVHDGEEVTVVGLVRAMTPEILDEWERVGVLRSESDRLVAEFASAFLEATELRSGKKE